MNKLIYIILLFTFGYSQNPEFKLLNISVSGNEFITDQDIINFSATSFVEPYKFLFLNFL